MKMASQAESVNVSSLSSKDTKFTDVRIYIPLTVVGQSLREQFKMRRG
jgi:hypothetical protein